LKAQRQYRDRRRLIAELTADGPQICPVPNCTALADSPHEPHTRGRGGSITDPANVVMLCWFHNWQISAEEPAWAYELGLLKHSWQTRHEFAPDADGYYCLRCKLPALNWRHSRMESLTERTPA
jgi:hypothetical protein